MNIQLIKFCEKMQNITQGNLRFYTYVNHNGFNQAVLDHVINGEIKACWMASNQEETEYLLSKFSHLL